MAEEMNLNYLVPFTILAESYRAGGDAERADHWKSLALEIARKSGKQEAVDALLKRLSK
jgi:hypothetical protein